MAITRLGPNNSTNISGINLTSQVTGTLPTGNGGTGATSFSPGKILQVVTGRTESETFTSSSTASDLLSVNITPSATSSKVLIIASVNAIRRDNSNGYLTCRVTDGSSFSEKLTHAALYNNSTGHLRVGGVTGTFVQSPSTTSQITYKLQISSPNNASVGVCDNNDTNSTLTLMEIAG